MTGYVQTLQVQIPHEIVHFWGWFLVLGIALLLLGAAAVARSVAATVATMLFFGWLLVMASAVEIAQAVLVGHWAGFFYHLLAAILFGIAGLMLVTRPLISAEALTILIAMLFLIGGIFQLVTSVAVALPGWGWQAADGIITFVLGVLVLARWPASGLWVIGLFVGIDLIFYGCAWIALALSLRASLNCSAEPLTGGRAFRVHAMRRQDREHHAGLAHASGDRDGTIRIGRPCEGDPL